MHPTPLIGLPGSAQVEPYVSLPAKSLGKIYVDLPHRYFSSIDEMKKYVREARDLGANVLLLLPHFLPSFSEYVVKDYEKPCPLFGTWKAFTEFMIWVEELGMDRMIDIPFNHADWQAEHLKRSWYKEADSNGIEAGADDCDADGNRVRINWGAYVLDNGNPELISYWLEKVIYPHVRDYHVNAIRIDAAWGLDPQGLTRVIRDTRSRFPHVWFLAENLGMDQLINLARTGLAAGAERYFNNYYWYTGGRGIPIDVYRLQKQGGNKPTCTIFGNHDVLMPAMRALTQLRADRYQDVDLNNPRAVLRRISEQEGLISCAALSAEERNAVVRRLALDFLLAAFLSTDVMFGAGSEHCLVEKVDVLRSGPDHFARGIRTELPALMKQLLQIKASDPLFNQEGTVMPVGNWKPGTASVKGYVRRSGSRYLLALVSTDHQYPQSFRLPEVFRRSARVAEYTLAGRRISAGRSLPRSIDIPPAAGLLLTTLED